MAMTKNAMVPKIIKRSIAPSPRKLAYSYLLSLKLHQHRKPHSRFILSKVGAEACSRHTGKAGSRRQKGTWHEYGTGHNGAGIRTGDHAGSSIHSWTYPTVPRPIRHIGMAIPILTAEGDVLLRHPVESERSIPGLERIAGVLCEVRRAGDGIGSIDRGQQSEIASGIAHRPASHGHGIPVFVEPEPVVQHPPGKGLLAAGGGVVMTIHVVNDDLSLRANACSVAAILASQVSGEREGHPVEKVLRPVVILDLDAIVRVDAGAAKLAIAVAQRIFAHAVIVEDHGEPRRRTPQNLSSQSWLAAQPAVGLPSVNDPGLDLKLVRGKPLDPDAVEEPGCVGRDIRRLIGPVVKVVVTEQANVRDENSRVKIEPMVHIEVITCVGFGYILIRSAEIPLPAPRAGIVAWRGDTEHPIHGEDSCADIVPVEVTAEANLLYLEFVGAKSLGRPPKAVVFRIIEAADVMRIKAYFRGEELRVPHHVLVARIAVEPGPVGISERHCWLGLGRRLRFRFCSGDCGWIGHVQSCGGPGDRFC